MLSRDGAARKLVGLITRRSLVQIQLPQPFIYMGYRNFKFFSFYNLTLNLTLKFSEEFNKA